MIMKQLRKITDYSQLTLVNLSFRIYHQSDEAALREILENRYCFHTHNRNNLNFWEFVIQLRHALSLYNEPLSEKTFDHLIDKFINLPELSGHNRNHGPDCRNQFRSFLHKFPGLETAELNDTKLEQFIEQEREFQKLVYRHFIWSQRECQREIEGWNRYNWERNGMTIVVYLPLSLPGQERKKWLETFIPDAQNGTPVEKERIQRIIDQYFRFTGRFLRIDDCLDELSENHPAPDSPFDQFTRKRLRDFIANEKASDISRLRPCIQKLGRLKVRKLVLTIMEEIAEDCFQPSLLAGKFGLQPSCMSHFAGREWTKKLIEQNRGDSTARKKGLIPEEAEIKIPDLYKNIAQYLAMEPEWIDAAKKSGVWDSITLITAAINKDNHNHG